MMHYLLSGPTELPALHANADNAIISVGGITKAHARKAIRWMRARSMVAFYRSSDKSLCAYEFKQGADWTLAALHSALDATAA